MERSNSSATTPVESPAERWLEAYAVGHCSRVNKILHWICAPLFVASIIGLLWTLPVPEVFSRSSGILNWGSLALMTAVVYYFVLSIHLALGMLPYVVVVIIGISWLDGLDTPLWISAGLVFAATAVAQIIGHLLEGGRASLVRDIHYLVIAPLWVLAAIYRKLGIKY